MRLLRELDTERAATDLRDALEDHGIEVNVAASSDGKSAIWVIEEDQTARAKELASSWLDAGVHDEYAAAVRRGQARREVRARVAQRAVLHRAALEAQMRAFSRPRSTPLTWGLIALSVAVAALTQLKLSGSTGVAVREQPAFIAMISDLLIADPFHFIGAETIHILGVERTWLALPWSQPWRLVTPILVHFGFLHILFNMMWMKDLGRVIEQTHGARYLALFVIVSGALSNIAQYEIAGSPMFGGMSGVVYGLLGLIWLGGRLRPSIGYGLPRSTVQFMLLWLAMGFVGNFGVANYCHLGGLAVGLGWAYIAHFFPRKR